MKKYIKYFFYVIEHKYLVFKCCIKRKLYIHAITHDLSKFLPDEFLPYAKYFYGKSKNEIEFKYAWDKHKNRNKHHYENESHIIWIKDRNLNIIPLDWWENESNMFSQYIEMKEKYVLQMICDLEAMSMKFKGMTAKEYFKKKIIIEIKFTKITLDLFYKNF
jgi:hypothetical protein